MTPYVVPLIPSQAQIVNVALAGTTYQLRLLWCAPNSAWTLDIFDATGTVPIIQGVALVSEVDLLAQYEYLGIGGQLIAVAIYNDPDDIGPNGLKAIDFNDLGVTGFVYFVTSP